MILKMSRGYSKKSFDNFLTNRPGNSALNNQRAEPQVPQDQGQL
jgi:hypothetical protein